MIKHDQHFLNDETIIHKTISNANITSKDTILEIGPGKGILTKAILNQNPKKLISIEIDENLKKYLEEFEKKYPNFELIISNAIEEISKLTPTKLIANIPYSITEPLYKQILQKKIPLCIILQGKNFTKKILNSNSQWNTYINALYNIEEIEEIEGDKFLPKTKTKSSLIKLTLKTNQTLKEQFMQNLYFNKKSKTKNAIQKTIGQTLSLTKKESKQTYDKLQIDIKQEEQILDNLNNNQFNKLINKIENKIF